MAEASGPQGLPDAFKDIIADRNEPPSAYFVNWFAGGADTRAPNSLFHSLGSGPHQAAPGGHTHDGSDSPYLFDTSPAISPISQAASNAEIIQALNAVITHLNSRGAGIARG